MGTKLNDFIAMLPESDQREIDRMVERLMRELPCDDLDLATIHLLDGWEPRLPPSDEGKTT